MTVLSVNPEGYQYTLADEDSETDRAAIQIAVKAYNDEQNKHFRLARMPGQTLQPLDIFLRDPSGEIMGGVTGRTVWDWLTIDNMWVAAPLRGHGYGRELLRYIEAIARTRGGAHVELKTYSFQARGFYEKQGYRVVGELEGFPPGASLYWMRKDLM